MVCLLVSLLAALFVMVLCLFASSCARFLASLVDCGVGLFIRWLVCLLDVCIACFTTVVCACCSCACGLVCLFVLSGCSSVRLLVRAVRVIVCLDACLLVCLFACLFVCLLGSLCMCLFVDVIVCV